MGIIRPTSDSPLLERELGEAIRTDQAELTDAPLAPQHSDPTRAAELTDALSDLAVIQQSVGSLTDAQAARAQKLEDELAKLRVQ